jgi:hypothetical protein
MADQSENETIEEYTERKKKEHFEKFQRELTAKILRAARKLQPDEKPKVDPDSE